DLVEAYEALTLVYRTVSNLGSLFRMEDITTYLVNMAVEAVEATGGVLYLKRPDRGFDVSAEKNGLGGRFAEDAPARLGQLGRTLFLHGELARDYARPDAEAVPNVLVAPLETGGRTLGLLVLGRDDDDRFTTGDTKLVAALCGVTAVAVANFQHYRAVSYEREMLEGVVREIGDGIVVTDDRWRTRMTNAAARGLLGVADADAEGYDLLDRLSGFSLSVPDHVLRALGDESVDFTAESLDRRRPLVLAGKAFRARLGTDAEPIHVLCLRDVTRESRQASAQRDFLSLASHKLRTPLTKILGLLPIARDPTCDAEQRHEAFDGIDSGAEELRDLVDGILQFVEFRQGERVVQAVDLRALTDEAIRWVRDRRRDRAFDVEVECAFPSAVVTGSRQMLFTMLGHLIDNAVKFSPGGVKAAVTVALSPELEGKALRVDVVDRGEGIAPELLKSLFQPFSQRDEEFTGQAEGSGLGLVLVRSVVEQHGGRLEAHSTLGVGTTLTVILPTDGT
ncbi:MAG: ATP-binding protein, partial [Planctomycetota bacterium JB042]